MSSAWFSKLRNEIEASDFLTAIVFGVTQNSLYHDWVYKIFRKKVAEIESNKRYGLAIETSSRCNASCVFCPNKKMKRVKSVMSMKIFQKLVDRLVEEKVDLAYVNLTGTGEPLMDPSIFDKIKILKERFPKTMIFMPTNFNLADNKMIKKILNSKLDKITISLNANCAKDYKEIMNLDFKKTIGNIEKLIKLKNRWKSELKIVMTVAGTSVNKKSLHNFVNRWKDRVDEVVINWVHTWAGAVDGSVDKRNWRRRYPCKSLFEQIVVHANGNIALCCVDYEGKIVGGNVARDSILKSFEMGKLARIKQLHRNDQIGKIKMCCQCRFSERGMDWLV